MELILRSKGLWDIVTGKEVSPTEDAAKAKYERCKDMALTHIILTIDDACSAAVITLRDPTQVWDKLKEMYKAVSEARVDAYLVQYQQTKMKDTEKVMQYVNRLSTIENRLAAVGHIMKPEEKRRVLLRGLHEEFNVVTGVIRATDKSFEDSISQLVTAEAEMNVQDTESDGEQKSTALYNQDVPNCSYCHKKGHQSDKCFFNPDSSSYRPQLAKKRNDRRRSRGNQSRFSRRRDSGRNYKYDRDKKNNAAYVDISLLTKLQEVSNLSNSKPACNNVKEKWFIDSGASAHMCNDPKLFQTFKPNETGLAVSVGDVKQAAVTGIGNIICLTTSKGVNQRVELKNVLCVPTLMCNLISVSRITKAGLMAIFDSEQGTSKCEVTSNEAESVYLTGFEHGNAGLYEALLAPVQLQEKGLIHSTNKELLWHERLGHVSAGTLQSSLPPVNGIEIQKITSIQTCENCELAKSQRSPRLTVPEESRNATKPLNLIHTDIVGPMKRPSLHGSRYFIPIYDDACGISLVRFLKQKSEAIDALKEMIAELETLYNGNVKRIRSDNGKEFSSHALQKWLKTKGIKQELTAPYSPESNGKAERLNRTLLDMARTMLVGSRNIPGYKRLWAEAVNLANYFRNRLYTTAGNIRNKTPFEAVMNKKPDLSHIRIFGSKAFAHIPKRKRKDKMAKRAEIGYCVGFTAGNSYKIYKPGRNVVISSRDIRFDEKIHTSSEAPAEYKSTANEIELEPNETKAIEQEDEIIPELITDGGDDANEDQEENTQSDGTESLTYYPDVRRSVRASKEPDRFIPGTLALMKITPHHLPMMKQ